jgi:hypothetical protein
MADRPLKLKTAAELQEMVRVLRERSEEITALLELVSEEMKARLTREQISHPMRNRGGTIPIDGASEFQSGTLPSPPIP